MKANQIISLKKFNAGLKLARKAMLAGEVRAALHMCNMLATARIARTGGRPAVTVKGCDVCALVTCGYTLIAKVI